MNDNLSEIVCIVDRSGSMHSIVDDAIGGFNAFLQEQQAAPGEATLTLALFNHGYQLVHDNVPIQDVAALDTDTYRPSGMTALLDAVGGARLTRWATGWLLCRNRNVQPR